MTCTDNRASLPFVIMGAGGHAKVVLSLLRANGSIIKGVCDPVLKANNITQWRDLEVLGDDSALIDLGPDAICLANGIGQTVRGTARRKLFERWTGMGFQFPALIHPSAWVDSSSELSPGVQVMAGAVIQPDTVIGANAIINTGARVDHDCILGADTHVAPGATLCGSVRLSRGAFIAAGAVVIQGLSVGEDAVVGAGAVLVRDLPNRKIVLGAKTRLSSI